MDNGIKRNYAITFGTGLLTQIITVAIAIITVPISIKYWGIEKYGIFAILTNFMAYLAMSNLGMNFAAIVLMGKAKGDNNVKAIFKRSLKIVVITEIILVGIFLILNIFWKNWIVILGKIPQIYTEEVRSAFAVMMIFFLINTIFSICDGFNYAYRKLYIQNMIDSLNKFVVLAALLITVMLKRDMVFYVFLSGAGAVFVNCIKAVYWFYFFRTKPENINTDSSDDTKYSVILQTGLSFLLFNTAATLTSNIDNIIISNTLGVQDIAAYSVMMKLFQISFLFIPLINNSMMPNFAREFANTNWKWINKTYENLLRTTIFVAGGIYISGIFLFEHIIKVWTANKIEIDNSLLWSYGIYVILISINNLNAGILGTFNYVKGKYWIAGWIELFTKIAVTLLLINKIGLVGIVIGCIVSSLMFNTLLSIYVITRKSGKMINFDFAAAKFGLVVLIVFSGVKIVIDKMLSTNLYINVIIGMVMLTIYLSVFLVKYKDDKNFLPAMIFKKIIKKEN